MRLRRAVICHHAGDDAAVEAFLNEPTEALKLSLDDALLVAGLYAARGRVGEALPLAYEVRRKHIWESKAHLFYVSLLLNIETRERARELSPTTVAIDTAVRIRDRSGHEEWHIIEEREDHTLPKELPPTHPLAASLLGHSVGDDVVVDDAPFATETVNVAAVQSKYIRALHESMESFQRLFPGVPGLWRVNLSLPTGVPGDPPDFEPGSSAAGDMSRFC